MDWVLLDTTLPACPSCIRPEYVSASTTTRALLAWDSLNRPSPPHEIRNYFAVARSHCFVMSSHPSHVALFLFFMPHRFCSLMPPPVSFCFPQQNPQHAVDTSLILHLVLFRPFAMSLRFANSARCRLVAAYKPIKNTRPQAIFITKGHSTDCELYTDG
jgi:hypothetical protein